MAEGAPRQLLGLLEIRVPSSSSHAGKPCANAHKSPGLLSSLPKYPCVSTGLTWKARESGQSLNQVDLNESSLRFGNQSSHTNRQTYQSLRVCGGGSLARRG
jgi:hypothetical protein